MVRYCGSTHSRPAIKKTHSRPAIKKIHSWYCGSSDGDKHGWGIFYFHIFVFFVKANR
jgi:hypothetical protein